MVPIGQARESFVSPATQASRANTDRAHVFRGFHRALKRRGVVLGEAGYNFQVHFQFFRPRPDFIDEVRIKRSEFRLNSAGAERGAVIQKFEGGLSALTEAK